jgi:hypothetical protein
MYISMRQSGFHTCACASFKTVDRVLTQLIFEFPALMKHGSPTPHSKEPTSFRLLDQSILNLMNQNSVLISRLSYT